LADLLVKNTIFFYQVIVGMLLTLGSSNPPG
jgi:hypothetical protein